MFNGIKFHRNTRTESSVFYNVFLPEIKTISVTFQNFVSYVFEIFAKTVFSIQMWTYPVLPCVFFMEHNRFFYIYILQLFYSIVVHGLRDLGTLFKIKCKTGEHFRSNRDITIKLI